MANGVDLRKVRAEIQKYEMVFDSSKVRTAFQKVLNNNISILLLDSKYWAASQEAWDLILQYNGVDTQKYVSDRYDCDDFAFSFKGAVSRKFAVNGVGLVIDFSGHHAYNCVLVHKDNDLSVEFIEPQNDQFVRKDAANAKACYQLTSGIVLI